MNNKHDGFTLVELLIVIVVIAILAAITLVTYNGIQDRAYNTAVIQAAGTAEKIIDITYTAEGSIMVDSGIPEEGWAFCIGDPSDFPATSDFDAGECHTNAKGGWASQELWDTLSEYGDGNLSTRSWYDGEYAHIRGVYYTYQLNAATDEYNEYLAYSLAGTDRDCTLPGAETVVALEEFYDGSNETSCWINMTERYGGADVINW